MAAPMPLNDLLPCWLAQLTLPYLHVAVVPCRVMSLAASKRANELEQSLNAWEDNRLLTSGVVKLKQVCVVAVRQHLQDSSQAGSCIRTATPKLSLLASARSARVTAEL